MPEVSRFFGIVIKMYYDEHNPPHFHAEYGGQAALISIDPIRIIEGKLSKTLGDLSKNGLVCINTISVNLRIDRVILSGCMRRIPALATQILRQKAGDPLGAE